MCTVVPVKQVNWAPGCKASTEQSDGSFSSSHRTWVSREEATLGTSKFVTALLPANTSHMPRSALSTTWLCARCKCALHQYLYLCTIEASACVLAKQVYLGVFSWLYLLIAKTHLVVPQNICVANRGGHAHVVVRVTSRVPFWFGCPKIQIYFLYY